MKTRNVWSAVLALGVVACGPVSSEEQEPAEQRGPLEAGCTQLGSWVVDHACEHVINGPYASVTASNLELFTTANPNINAAHTYYTVSLPGSGTSYKGTVRFVPGRTNSWAFFTNPDVPVKLTNSSGTVLPPALSHTVSGCGLQRVTVYNLTQNGSRSLYYLLTLGTTSSSTVGVSVERVEEHNRFYFQDADSDSYGNTNVFKLTACTPPAGYVLNDTDCNDSNASIRPGATETCGDGVDSNCNGSDCT